MAALARAYAEGGAVCLSVLTEPRWFLGAPEYVAAARAATPLPVLRKDFIVDEWQVAQSRALGADCILLIVAALTDAELVSFAREARAWNMDVLVEAHDAEELARAVAVPDALVGINNRDLRTLSVDPARGLALAAEVPPGRTIVAESGLSTPSDLARYMDAGVHCFLVGEALMREPDVEAATRRLLGAAMTLTHLDADGAARMVDVGQKPTTGREAVAEGRIVMSADAAAAIRAGAVKKGGRARGRARRGHHGGQAHRRSDPRSATCYRSHPPKSRSTSAKRTSTRARRCGFRGKPASKWRR